jgi:hypothetical protein
MASAHQIHNDGSDDEWKQVAELRAVAEAQDPACKVRSTIPLILSRSSIPSRLRKFRMHERVLRPYHQPQTVPCRELGVTRE